MPLWDRLNQLKGKAEELNRKHNILPIGQNAPQQSYNYNAHPPPPQQHYQQPQQYHQQHSYPGQHPYPYQAQGQPQGQPQPYHSYEQPQPPQPNYGTRPGVPPPIPSHSRPPASSHADPNPGAHGIYWRPSFSPGVPVSHEFEQKQGHGDPWGWGNNELQNYTSSATNSFHTPDGALVLRAVSQPQHPDPEARFTSARLVSRATLGRRSGCLTAWLRLPCAGGIWPAFWLLPREPFTWPHEGEVDIAETWNGDCENHSCLHWGFYTPEDAQKHLVRGTRIPDMAHRPVRFDFVWQVGGIPGSPNPPGSRLMWYIDGRPVMKNLMPAGTRPIEDWTVLLNIAMGGNVCQGQTPREGTYDMVVHGLQMTIDPEGGWRKFDHDWGHCPDGAVM